MFDNCLNDNPNQCLSECLNYGINDKLTEWCLTDWLSEWLSVISDCLFVWLSWSLTDFQNDCLTVWKSVCLSVWITGWMTVWLECARMQDQTNFLTFLCSPPHFIIRLHVHVYGDLLKHFCNLICISIGPSPLNIWPFFVLSGL